MPVPMPTATTVTSADAVVAAAEAAVAAVTDEAQAPVQAPAPTTDATAASAAPAPSPTAAPDPAPVTGTSAGETSAAQPAAASSPAPDPVTTGNTADNSEKYRATTTQYQPTNIVVIIRINSPGDDIITQTNTAISSVVSTTTQTVIQAAETVGTVGSDLPTLPTGPALPLPPIELPAPLPPIPTINVPVPPVEAPLPSLPVLPAVVPVVSALVRELSTPVELRFEDDVSRPRGRPLARAPAPTGDGSTRGGGTPFFADDDVVWSSVAREAAMHASRPGARRAARERRAEAPRGPIPARRVLASGFVAPPAGGGVGAGALPVLLALLAAYALVPPAGHRRLRRTRVRAPSGVDASRREHPG